MEAERQGAEDSLPPQRSRKGKVHITTLANAWHVLNGSVLQFQGTL